MKRHRWLLGGLLLTALLLLLWWLLWAPVQVPESSAESVSRELPSPLPTARELPGLRPTGAGPEKAFDLPALRFYKVDVDGHLVPDEAEIWSCIYDSSTGLMWENKRDDGGWQDREHTYSWYRPPDDGAGTDDTGDDNGVTRQFGVADGGDCYGSSCDTAGLVAEMNRDRLCGSAEWRVPEAHELRLLEHPVNYYPDIDTRYFPNTMSGRYWSNTEVPNNPSLAWSVDFNNGFPYIAEKRLAFHLRLVTEAPWLNDIVDQRE